MSRRRRDERGARVYRRLLGYTTAHWAMFALALCGMVVYALTETGFAAIIKPLLDQSFVERDPTYIRLMPLAILGIFIVRGIASFASTYCMAMVGGASSSRSDEKCLISSCACRPPISIAIPRACCSPS